MVQACIIHLIREHVPVRVPEVLGPDRPRSPPGLHRRVGGGGVGAVRGVRGEVGQAVSGGQPAVAQRLVRVRAVPGLQVSAPRRVERDTVVGQQPLRHTMGPVRFRHYGDRRFGGLPQATWEATA